MSWFSKSTASTGKMPPATPLQQQRLKQIKSLQSCNPNVTEVDRDNEYTVSFQTGGKTVTLHVLLPPTFPNDKPTVQVAPPVKHSLVNESMKVVGSYPLNSFYMHSDLGKIIQQIVKEFKKQPPEFLAIDMPPVPAGFTSNTQWYDVPASLPSYSQAASTSDYSSTDVIAVDEANTILENPPEYQDLKKVYSYSSISNDEEVKEMLNKIGHFKKMELEELLTNDDKFIEYTKDLKMIAQMKEDRLRLIKENEELARANVALEPELEELQVNLKETFEEYNELLYRFEQKDQQQDELANFYSIGAISTNLRISVLQAEEDSERIAEDFLDGNIKVDAFLTSFIEKRKECHLRWAKEEQLKIIHPY